MKPRKPLFGIPELPAIKRDDVIIKFLQKTPAGEIDLDGGFVIYLRHRKRAKTFLHTFKARELMRYMADWESWPEPTAAELALCEAVLDKGKPI